MPWYSSGTNYGPEIAMQGAAALTKLGQQMDERFDKLNQEGKASDAFFKANPEALDEMNIGEGQWKSMGAMQKSGILKGYLQSSGYKKAQAEQANVEALTQYHQAMTQHLQQEQQSTAAQPGFWSAFANAETNGPRLRDYYENPEKYNGPPAASLQDAIRAGMEASPNAIDDRLGTALVHYGFGGGAKQNGPADIRRLTDRLGVVEKPGSLAFQVVPYEQGGQPPTSDIEGIKAYMNPKSGAAQFLPPGPGAPTTGFKTRLQEGLQNYDTAMSALTHIERNMNASDFGVRGVAKETFARIYGQIDPSAIKPEDMDVRKAIRTLRADLYKSLRSDANIAEPERRQIEKMLPSEGLNESLPDAVTALLNVKRTLTEKTRASSFRLGVRPPAWAMNIQEIANAYMMGEKAIAAGVKPDSAEFKSKFLTAEEATEAVRQFHLDK